MCFAIKLCTFQNLQDGKSILTRQSSRMSLLSGSTSNGPSQKTSITEQPSNPLSLNHTDTVIQPIKIENGPAKSKDDQSTDAVRTTHVQKLTTLMRQHSTIDTIMANKLKDNVNV